MRANASATAIREVLGVLQDDPDGEAAWTELQDGVAGVAATHPAPEILRDLIELLRAARHEHEQRREYEAVAKLLEIELSIVEGEEAISVLRELARVRDEELLDDEGTMRACERILEALPSDPVATEAVEKHAARREKWQDLAARYLSEAKEADDATFKSSLLVSAAEILYRYGAGADPDDGKAKRTKKKGRGKTKSGGDSAISDRTTLLESAVTRLEEALSLDPASRRGTLLMERVLRDLGRFDDLALRLSTFADASSSKEERLAAVVRLARLYAKRLGANERAAEAYERVLDLAPGHVEATSKLVDYFTEQGRWDHLVSLYEGQLRGGTVAAEEELGIVLQIAMVHWKMRENPAAAAPYFGRVRRVDPAHPGMLAFFREYARSKGDVTELIAVLSEAEKVLPQGAVRSGLQSELAALAEETADAQRAIDHWRTIVRSDPSNVAARDSLKRLYRQTGAFHHLADLLRSELEAAPSDDRGTRLPLLAELADIHRTHLKSDSALVPVLSQILALDPADASAVRELARVYEALGRWRDLLTIQLRLAELESDASVKGELYRSIARRWLDQFSNVQNAVEAYELLLEVNPTDREASERLKELYAKRRAYRPLFDLFESEASRATGAARRALWFEMAKLAGERLDRGEDATRLYKQILAEAPDDLTTLDALERHAEREKDFATVAEALEGRAEVTVDEAQKLAVLQKLGSVYGDRLHDAAGALRTWKRVLAISPAHTKALRILRESYLALGDYDGLSELYAPEQDWDGLVEVLSAAADRASDATLKVELSLRCAALYEGKLGAPDRAWRAYERILSVVPDDERAARALVGICEREERWSRIPALLGILLAHARSDEEQRDLSRKLAEIQGAKLGDRAAAFAASARVFALSRPDATSVGELEQAARASGEWSAFATLLERRIAETEGEDGRVLRLTLAEAWASQLGQAEDAIRVYRELLERTPDDEEALSALDRVVRTTPGHHDDLRWLFRHKVERAEGEAKAALLREWAMLEEEVLASTEGAVTLHRELLAAFPEDASSLRALARLLQGLGEHEEAATLLERERDLVEGAERATRELGLARLYMGPLKRPLDALSAAVRALELSSDAARPAITVIESLLSVPEARARAAAALEGAYEARGEWAKQGDALAVLIATAPSKQDRVVLLGRLADARTKLGDPSGAFDVLRRAVGEQPAERALWDRLAALATQIDRTQDYVSALTEALGPDAGGLPVDVERDLAERAAIVHDEVLADVDHAAAYWERVWATDPTNEQAFGRLKQIFTARARWRDVERLYERAFEVSDDARRRVELLGELAVVAEDATNNAPLAIHHYERVLVIDPANERALASLDRLYTSESRWPKLAELLERRLSSGDVDADADLGLRLRFGRLLFVELGDPKRALDHLEAVVLADASIREARELVEKSLSHPDLRQRAAVILERAYTERGEMRELVKVLDVRLEFASDDAEKADLLRRLAELREEGLTDDRGAMEAYARLLPLTPDDAEARQRYLRIASRQGSREPAAEVLALASKSADSVELRCELLGEAAAILEEAGRTERAEALWRQILELAPDDPALALPAARALDRTYSKAADKARELANVLAVQVKLEASGPLRRELLGRLARVSAERTGEDSAAIAAWKACLEDDPSDPEALAELDRLYERTADHRSLVEVLRAREQRADDPAVRRELTLRAARALEGPLGDRASAISAYRGVLDDFGPDRETLAALGRLYTKAEAWPDVAEIRDMELALATTPAERVALLSDLGSIRHRKLAELPAAVEAYGAALDLDPSVEAPRAALEELLDDDNVRAEAATVLRALYEKGGADERLLQVLDVQIDCEAGDEERLELLARAVDVAQRGQAPVARVFGYVDRGARTCRGSGPLAAWVARAEALTERTGAWSDLVQLYRELVPDVADDEQRLAMLLRTADLARTKLADTSLAKQTYRAALDVRGEDPTALSALERLYEEAKEFEPLLEILQRRTEASSSDEEKRALLAKQARICQAELSDRDRAVEFNERILDIDFDRGAVSALEGLYAALGRWGDLVALHERELDRTDTEVARRADLHQALGELYDRELADPDRAFEEFERALRIDALHTGTIAVLERKMGQPHLAARAATILEAVYVARLDWRNVMRAVEARLSASDDPEERKTLLRRLAKLHEEQEENYEAALGVAADLLHEDPTLETTWAELERLARVSNAEPRLAEIYARELDGISSDEPATARLARRAGELFEAHGAEERALGLYRRAYAFDPDLDPTTFAAIDRILTRLARPSARVALYRDALDLRTGDEERISTLRTIASLEEEGMGDVDAAIVAHRAVLDIDEADATSYEALRRLLTQRERFVDLADLVRRRAEQSALPEDEAAYRLDLAKLLEERLADPAAAIDELETVWTLIDPVATEVGRATTARLEGLLQIEGQRARLIELLSPIYEKAEDWNKLIELSEHRLGLATSVGDKVLVLRERAEVFEVHKSDLPLAFEALRTAFVLDPDDGETLEQLERVATLGGLWDGLADAYEGGIAKLDGVGQRSLLAVLAKLHDERRDDPRRALDAWQRLFELDESDERPLDAMDQLATLLSDWPVLVRVLVKRVDLTPDEEMRASLWRRIGEARRDMLDDLPGAVDAYDHALELEPDSTFTIDNLIEANEALGDASRLVDLYSRRIELCGEDDDALRRQLILDTAKAHEVGLGDRRAAISVLEHAQARYPGDAEMAERLGSLFEAEGLWHELLENLAARASAASEPEKRTAFKKRMADVQAKELEDRPAALLLYREVLESGYDEDVVRAVVQLGVAEVSLRREVTDLVEPVLRQRVGTSSDDVAAWKLLVSGLELRVASSDDPLERVRARRDIARAAESPLDDRAKAETALAEALVDAPSLAELHDEAERLANLGGADGLGRYADVLTDLGTTSTDPTVRADLLRRLGRIAETSLGDGARAAEAYTGALDALGTDVPDLLVALERVFGALGDAGSLAGILRRRLATTDGDERAEVFARLGKVEVDELGDVRSALKSLGSALALRPSEGLALATSERLLDKDEAFDDAFAILERAYRASGSGTSLATLFERRVRRASSVGERTAARLALAGVLEQDVHDLALAQRAIEAALAEDFENEQLLDALEGIAARGGAWAEAVSALSSALDGALASHGREPSAEAWSRLGRWQRDHLSNEAAAEESFARALARDPESRAIARALEGTRRRPGRERERVDVLRKLVQLESELEAKRTAAREALGIAEGLGDPSLAEGVLRALLVEAEADGWALAELTRFRELAGDNEEVLGLLLRRADVAPDGRESSELRHRAATLLVDRIGDKPRALALYEAILDQDPADLQAQVALSGLYENLERYEDLARHLEGLIDTAPTVADRSTLRLRLATLQVERFDARDQAARTLRDVLDEDPDSVEAIAALRAIFEKTSQNAELADLQKHIVDRARARGDEEGEVAATVCLGELYEERLSDLSAALRTYEEALARRPHHEGALRAVARLAERRGHWDRAAEVLASLVNASDPAGTVDLSLRLAAARAALGDEPGVEAALRGGLASGPTNVELRRKLQESLRRSAKWSDLADLLVEDADLLRKARSVDEPEAAGQVATASEVALLREAAETYMREGQAGKAAPVLERATALAPDDRDLLLLLCDAYAATQMDREAALVLERIIASFGAKRTKELSIYHHRLGRVRARLGDADVALAEFDMAFRINPGSIEVLRDLGVFALEHDDLDRAHKTFQALLLQRFDAASVITKGEVFYYLGEVNLKQGNKAKAVQMLERALETEPSLARAREMLSSLKN